jgi:hypothetical protein
MPEVLDVEQAPVVFIELAEKKGSGFIQDGTENTANPIELNAPAMRYIPNVGFRRGTKKDPVTGKDIRYNEAIRFIRNESEISVERQKLLGIEPSRIPSQDKIVIQSGSVVVVRDLGNEGLYDFLTQAYYNESNPERSQKATPLYRIVLKDNDAENDYEDSVALADVLNYMNSLAQKVGDRKYKYNTEKIDGLCVLFNAYADTTATKLKALTEFGKTRPVEFMKAVTQWENITQTEITHGLKLNVIKFEGNMAQYSNRDKMIKSLGTEKMKTEDKIALLADWFKTPDGNEEYTNFKSALELAKEK